MGRYYKLDSTVYFFDEDQLHLVTENMKIMSDVEVDRHINPEKYMSPQQRADFKAATYRPISKLQLKLTLLSEGLLVNFENYISEIQDPVKKLQTEIIYADSLNFTRLSDFIVTSFTSLGLAPEDINSFWEKAINI